MHYTFSEFLVASPAARSPVSRISGWFAFSMFVLVFGLTMAAILVVASPSLPRDPFYSKSELQALIMGETPTEVIVQLGKPYQQRDQSSHGRSTYVYMRLVRNSPTATVAPEAHIHFTEDSFGTLRATDLSTYWGGPAPAARDPVSR
jgi:hypothetical protein